MIGRPTGLRQPKLHSRMDLDRQVEHQKIRGIHISRVLWWIGLETTTPCAKPPRASTGCCNELRTFLIQLSVRPGSPHLQEQRARSSTRNVVVVQAVKRLTLVSQPRGTNQPQQRERLQQLDPSGARRGAPLICEHHYPNEKCRCARRWLGLRVVQN